MATWVLVPDLVSLRNEFNALSPGRDKASDGSIGDVAHSQGPSDHNPDETGATSYEDSDNINEVHAIDVDEQLRLDNWTMDRAVQIIVLRHRSGQDDRLQNVIHNRVIYSRTWGWTGRVYTGSDPHTGHAHFSSRYGSGSTQSNPENITKPWGLLAAEEGEDDMSAQDAYDGVSEFFFAAKHAATVDSAYTSASAEDQKAMRNARDTVQDTIAPIMAAPLAALNSKLDTTIAKLDAVLNPAGGSPAARK